MYRPTMVLTIKRREAEAMIKFARNEVSGVELARVEKLRQTLRDSNLREARRGRFDASAPAAAGR